MQKSLKVKLPLYTLLKILRDVKLPTYNVRIYPEPNLTEDIFYVATSSQSLFSPVNINVFMTEENIALLQKEAQQFLTGGTEVKFDAVYVFNRGKTLEFIPCNTFNPATIITTKNYPLCYFDTPLYQNETQVTLLSLFADEFLNKAPSQLQKRKSDYEIFMAMVLGLYLTDKVI